MIPDEKIINLLVKLNKLTSLGQLQWDVQDPPRTIAGGTDDYVPLFLTTTYKGQRFGLFQRRYRWYDGEHDRFSWCEQLVLAILDNEGRVLWETPQSSALFDLFETARKKVSNVDKLIDDLLEDGNGT